MGSLHAAIQPLGCFKLAAVPLQAPPYSAGSRAARKKARRRVVVTLDPDRFPWVAAATRVAKLEVRTAARHRVGGFHARILTPGLHLL